MRGTAAFTKLASAVTAGLESVEEGVALEVGVTLVIGAAEVLEPALSVGLAAGVAGSLLERTSPKPARVTAPATTPRIQRGLPWLTLRFTFGVATEMLLTCEGAS